MGIGSSLKGFWMGRSPRERSILLAGAVLLSVSALYAFLWEPGLEARARLSAALPRLRVQLEDMRGQQKEIASLRKTPGGVQRGADVAALVRTSAGRRGLLAAADRIDASPNDGVRVTLSAVSFDAWLEWVSVLQREFGVRLSACEITALGNAGMVAVQATFARAAVAPPGERNP